MKTGLLIVSAFGMLVFLAMSGMQYADALCVTNADWPDAPCYGCIGCYPGLEQEKLDWAPYYDFKGSTWMETKKQQLDSAIQNNSLREWFEQSDNGAHKNVHLYYFLYGDVPNIYGMNFDEALEFERTWNAVKSNSPDAPVLLWNYHDVILDGTLIETDLAVTVTGDHAPLYNIKANKYFKGEKNSDMITAVENPDDVDFDLFENGLFYLKKLEHPHLYTVTIASAKTFGHCDARSLIEISPTLPNEQQVISMPAHPAAYVDLCVPEYYDVDPDKHILSDELFPEPEQDMPVYYDCRPGTTLQDGICVINESDKTIDILQKIMDAEDPEIPITSLYVNPKDSVITVGIDDRKNPLFTLDIYKTMLYKQVGNIFLNIVPDYTSTKEKLCDVNDAAKVRDSLNDDPVVQQFLKYYPSSTFEHFKTYDEPGNPRTYSEFRYGLFLLQVLVLTHDESGACYPAYGYSVSYDDPKSEIRKDFFKDTFDSYTIQNTSDSNTIQDAIDAIKDLSNPLKQHKFGILNPHIKCKDPLVVLVKEHNQNPSCVTESTSSKLLSRGWIEPISCSDECELDIVIDKKTHDLFEPKIEIVGLNDFYDIFEPINFAITFESYGVDHGGYEVSINGIDDENNDEAWYEAKDVPMADTPPESFSHTYEFPRRDSNPIVFSKPGWYEVSFFVSDSERAKWNFRVQYNEQLDFTNNVQEFQDKLDSSMKYEDLVWTFGEPDDDIGSGIHIYVYDMDDKSKVLIGYGGYIWYAKHVDYNYNLMKDLFEENED